MIGANVVISNYRAFGLSRALLSRRHSASMNLTTTIELLQFPLPPATRKNTTLIGEGLVSHKMITFACERERLLVNSAALLEYARLRIASGARPHSQSLCCYIYITAYTLEPAVGNLLSDLHLSLSLACNLSEVHAFFSSEDANDRGICAPVLSTCLGLCLRALGSGWLGGWGKPSLSSFFRTHTPCRS